MSSKTLISNRKLFAGVIAVFILCGIGVTYMLSGYLKQIALNNLAEDNAKKTSELVFEVMYAKMEQGWDKEQIIGLTRRLNHLKSGMDIRLYRAQSVRELYGSVEQKDSPLPEDRHLKRALSGEVVFLPDPLSGDVRYLYPIKVKQECLKCHTNTTVGAVNGVIDMHLPSEDIQIPLDNILKYFLIFTVAAIIVTFLIFQLLMNRIFIRPISKFTDSIEAIHVNETFNEPIHCHPKTHEIYVLESAFNHLLARINTMLANLRHNNKLLEEYKQAIDHSTIVTKTDTKGIITYVNDAFCTISGYSRDELIGKNHNLVRSPNMPSQAFRTLWENISHKKPWSGVIENRRKNGESYFVQATIMPILDEHNSVTEYIAIRQDITELKRLQAKELFEKVSRARSIGLEEAAKILPFPAAMISESGDILYKNPRFHTIFSPDQTPQNCIESLLREEAFFQAGIPDWKNIILSFQDESSYTVRIPTRQSTSESFVIMLSRIDEERYIIFLFPVFQLMIEH